MARLVQSYLDNLVDSVFCCIYNLHNECCVLLQAITTCNESIINLHEDRCPFDIVYVKNVLFSPPKVIYFSGSLFTTILNIANILLSMRIDREEKNIGAKVQIV